MAAMSNLRPNIMCLVHQLWFYVSNLRPNGVRLVRRTPAKALWAALGTKQGSVSRALKQERDTNVWWVGWLEHMHIKEIKWR